jgi:UDP-N-acetylglucosamine 2-epimerase
VPAEIAAVVVDLGEMAAAADTPSAANEVAVAVVIAADPEAAGTEVLDLKGGVPIAVPKGTDPESIKNMTMAHAVMMTINPSMVLVHGDTSSALMAAMAAFYRQCPVAHVEAGLRSHNEYNPFPEEKNRVLIGQLAQWHFAPTMRAKQNLLSEGIDASGIHVVGNTIVEAARLGLSKLASYQKEHRCELIEQLAPSLATQRLVMVTMHRRENQESNIKLIAQTVVKLLRDRPDMTVVWPVHPNPKVEKAVYSVLEHVPAEMKGRLHITRPLDYPVLLWVLKNSWLVMTDSGGIQEEAAAMNVPVLVLRDTTERQEIIESGAGILVGTKKENILRHVERLERNPEQYRAMQNVKNPYGDGTTAAQICEHLIGKDESEKQYA